MCHRSSAQRIRGTDHSVPAAGCADAEGMLGSGFGFQGRSTGVAIRAGSRSWAALGMGWSMREGPYTLRCVANVVGGCNTNTMPHNPQDRECFPIVQRLKYRLLTRLGPFAQPEQHRRSRHLVGWAIRVATRDSLTDMGTALLSYPREMPRW